MALDGFSALQFVQPAPKVLAEIKTTIFYNAFCPLILQLKLLKMPFKIDFGMTWLRWQSHCAIFRMKKANELAV